MRGQTESLVVRALILTESGVILAQVLGRNALVSVLFAMTLLEILGLWLMTLRRNLDRCNGLVLVILLVSGICVLGNALVTGTQVSAGYFKKLLLFWSTLLTFGAMGVYVPKKAEVELLFRCCTGLSIFLVGMYGLFREEMHMIDGTLSGFLTFRFTNPNLTAVFLSGLSILMGIRAAFCKGLDRIGAAVLVGILTAFVWKTGSRNGQLVMGFFLLFGLLTLAFPRSRRRLMGISLVPLLFVAAYVGLVPVFTENGWLSFLTSAGKGLDSRMTIWESAWKNILASPLLGAYSQISEGSGLSQMHNSHLDILASYGVLTLGLVCLFLAAMLEKPVDGARSQLCRVGFCGMLVSGVGEAVLFSGGLGVSALAGFLLMLGNFHGEEGELYENPVSEQLF